MIGSAAYAGPAIYTPGQIESSRHGVATQLAGGLEPFTNAVRLNAKWHLDYTLDLSMMNDSQTHRKGWVRDAKQTITSSANSKIRESPLS
jgi:hypothetical protein